MKDYKKSPVRVLLAGACLSLSVGACKRGGEVDELGAETQPDVATDEAAQEPAAGDAGQDGATDEGDRPPSFPINPPGFNEPPLAEKRVADAPPLPSWDEVKSGHPEGATNPPSPFLVVTPEGRCFKEWRGMMAPPQPGVPFGDRVQECGEEDDCGAEVQCPQPKTSELLADWSATKDKPVPEKPADGLPEVP